MLGWLAAIFGVVAVFHQLVLWAIVTGLNLLIAAIGAFIAGLVALLPAMPAAPGAPSSGVLGLLSWLAPIGGLLTILAGAVALWAAWLVIRIPLRWAKVV